MNKTFNIYCDESTHMVHDGHPYMLLGCTSIAYTQIRMAKDAIKDIKKKHGYSDELKWTNVHEATYGKSSVSCPLKPSDSAPLC